MTTINLKDLPTTLDLFADRYNIYFTGGRHIKLPRGFQIDITNKKTGDKIPVFQHDMKVQDLDGIRHFYFDVAMTGSYEISVLNYENIIVHKSMLFLGRLLFPPTDIKNVGLKIERKHH